jgi:hypothetical protein
MSKLHKPSKSTYESSVLERVKERAEKKAQDLVERYANKVVDFTQGAGLAGIMDTALQGRSSGSFIKPSVSIPAEKAAAKIMSHDAGQHMSAITLPASAGEVMYGGASVSVGGAPSIGGLGTGNRLVASFESFPAVQTASTGGRCPANAWSPSTQTDDAYSAIYLNPCYVNTYLQFFAAVGGGSVNSCYALPMCLMVPKLAQICQCFNRFRIRFLRIQSIGRQATSQEGAFRMSRISDVFRLPDQDWDDQKNLSSEEGFNWVSNQQSGAQCPVWAASMDYVAIDERRGKSFSKLAKEDLLYTSLDVNDSTANTTMLDATELGWRNSIQGAVLGVTDLARQGAGPLYNKPLRRQYWHVVIDLYELNLAPVTYDHSLARTADRAAARVVLDRRNQRRLEREAQLSGSSAAEHKGEVSDAPASALSEHDLVLVRAPTMTRTKNTADTQPKSQAAGPVPPTPPTTPAVGASQQGWFGR